MTPIKDMSEAEFRRFVESGGVHTTVDEVPTICIDSATHESTEYKCDSQ